MRLNRPNPADFFGRWVRYSTIFHHKASARFNLRENSANQRSVTIPNPTPLLPPQPREGLCIGFQRAIMADYRFHCPFSSVEDYDPPSATGKMGMMLKVVEAPNQKDFYLVKLEEAEMI